MSTTACGEPGCGGEVAADGFCDTCGAGGAPASTPPRSEPVLARAGESGAVCPDCGVARADDAAFCEACGFDFDGGAGTRESVERWEATVAVDPGWYDAFRATWSASRDEPCPVELPEPTQRRVALDGTAVIVGRHASGIDLASDPNDPAVSHRHVSLVLHPDGTWWATDLESSNGTFVAGRQLAAGQAVRLAEGGSITLGAFTRITLSRRTP